MNALLVTLHRWIGVVLCLLFLSWFASGIVLIYVPFPALPEWERQARAPDLDLTRLNSIADVLASPETDVVERVRLKQFMQRPALIAERAAGEVQVSFADTGEMAPRLDAATASAIAAEFTGKQVAAVSPPLDYDQWIVHQQFDPYRPFYRVSLADAEGTQLYVSQLSGDVVQRTTTSQRAWNYVGAVLHWIYPTIIRKNWALWDQLVWWLALIGIVGAVLGIVLGVQRLQQTWRRSARGLASPFLGWMGWHHKLGLVFGIIVLSWIFSGWLSMDHGRLFSVPEPETEQLSRFRGLAFDEIVSKVPVSVLEQLNDVKEIEFSAVNGNPVVLVRHTSESQTLFIEADGNVLNQLSPADIAPAIAQAWPANSIVQSQQLTTDDVYTSLREGSLGPNVLRVILDDEPGTWVHVDLESGRILSVMDRSRRAYRWLYNGLHSLDFPGLANRRPMWDILMITLMTGGLVFSATGVVIAFRRVRPGSG